MLMGTSWNKLKEIAMMTGEYIHCLHDKLVDSLEDGQLLVEHLNNIVQHLSIAFPVYLRSCPKVTTIDRPIDEDGGEGSPYITYPLYRVTARYSIGRVENCPAGLQTSVEAPIDGAMFVAFGG